MPQLALFMGGYMHRPTQAAEGVWDLLDAYLEVFGDASDDLVRDLDRLMTNTDVEIQRQVTALGATYRPEDDGLTYRSWISEVRRRVSEWNYEVSTESPSPEPSPDRSD